MSEKSIIFTLIVLS